METPRVCGTAPVTECDLLRVSERIDGDFVVVGVQGDVDLTNAVQLRARLPGAVHAASGAPEAGGVVLDLRDAAFLSAGMTAPWPGCYR